MERFGDIGGALFLGKRLIFSADFSGVGRRKGKGTVLNQEGSPLEVENGRGPERELVLVVEGEGEGRF